MRDFVKIVEVGPRDGLQNENQTLSVEQKVNFINALSGTGLTSIEAGSFVSPKWVPQMASSKDVFAAIQRIPNVIYSALTPNEKGLDDAIEANVDEVAIFTGASESFVRKNINCSIDESIERFKPVMSLAKSHNLRVRGYVSCVLGCPYEGNVEFAQVQRTVEQLFDIGCYEISLGDTIGVGTASQAKSLIHLLKKGIPVENLAVHFHDTYGQALANIYATLEEGVRVVDSASAGLGGCPYAKGASGNVATEDVVYMLEGSGYDTGINLDKLIAAGNEICHQLNKKNRSKVANALK